ncbi:PRC-barrel domain containing protein [Verrucosispora sp. WMMA2044]|uniref:PRC-barrel domain containing protein n=1 Tax=Verrucosispora sioxanthis TaxID=2499994 RepID=A0A6M1KZS7_9ACTN|nr:MULTISPECIES: PRC-barrel domain containing protein [Micromonospora]NEE62071.1 PRC-barrel domain containing protein [Verrucosispora sioxanthis]NGM11181.1 PRC-barrel domain containing protein [Verrucosispora sioxanthis]WBB46408.1 PRC-barrel domain containing protein [Verrucosispora sp. WMMA2044]
MRAGDLLGRTAYDPQGRRVGRVVDLVLRGPADGPLRLTDLVVTRHWYGRLSGRLIGPQRHPSGPWAIRALARLLARSTWQVPVHRVRLDPPLPGRPDPGRPHDADPDPA